MARGRVVAVTRAGTGISTNALIVFLIIALFIGYKLWVEPSDKDEDERDSQPSSQHTTRPVSTQPTNPPRPPSHGSSAAPPVSATAPPPISPAIPPPLPSGVPFPLPSAVPSAVSTSSGLDTQYTDYTIDLSDSESDGDVSGYQTDLTDGGGRRRAGKWDPLPGYGILKGGRRPLMRPPGKRRIRFPPTLAATDQNQYIPEGRPIQVFNTKTALYGAVDDWKAGRGAKQHFESKLPEFEQRLVSGGYITSVAGMKDVESLMGTTQMAGRGSVDRWEEWSRWGKLPGVIIDLCLEFVRSKAIDITELAEAMKEVPSIWKSKGRSARFIVNRGFTVVNGRHVARDDFAATELLLGWFALSYRGYESQQWTSSVDVKTSGFVLDPTLEATVGETTAAVLKWLSWAGRRYLVCRMFTPLGADLLDGSVRVYVARLIEGSDAHFKMDVVIFAPASEELAEPDKAKAHWLKFTVQQGRREQVERVWLKDAIVQAIDLSRQWIDQHLTSDAIKLQRNYDPNADRIKLRRLFIRPGYANDLVDRATGSTSAPAAFTTNPDPRRPALALLDVETLTSALDGAAGHIMKEMMSVLQCSLVRFYNLRQNNWHTPAEGSISADQFDARQIAYMLGVIGAGLHKRGAERLPPHLRNDQSELNAVENRDVGVPKIHLDFGGIMPVIEPHKFVGTDLFNRVSTYYIPLVPKSSPALRLMHPSTTVVGSEPLDMDGTVGWLWSTDIIAEVAKGNGKLIVVIVMDNLEDDDNIIYPDVDKQLMGRIDAMVTRGKDSQDDMIEAIRGEVEVLSKWIKITTVEQCQSGVDMPKLWDLGYCKKLESLAKAEELIKRAGMLRGIKVVDRGKR